jgi:hypothetical protein
MSRAGLTPLILITLILVVIIDLSCIKRVEQSTKPDYLEYFPLHVGDWRQYSGPLEKTVTSGRTENLFTQTCYNSMDSVIFICDFIQRESGIFCKGFLTPDKNRAVTFFEPALPFSPWSMITGDTLFRKSIDIELGSTFDHNPITIEYEMLGMDTVIAPAGEFNDCIKIQINLSFPETSIFSVENKTVSKTTWWYAKDIGIVKYIFANMSGVLVAADINGISYPQMKN